MQLGWLNVYAVSSRFEKCVRNIVVRNGLGVGDGECKELELVPDLAVSVQLAQLL
jgi:hypothetical protein